MAETLLHISACATAMTQTPPAANHCQFKASSGDLGVDTIST